MFATLKNKIKEETGNDVCATNQTFSSSSSAAHRRTSLNLNNFNNNNNNIDTGHSSAFVPPPSYSNGAINHSASTLSPIDQLNAVILRKNAEIAALKDRFNDIDTKLAQLTVEHNELLTAKTHLEKTNRALEDALRLAQSQRELINGEQDKIQNLQAQEISKLKSLLHFREQVRGHSCHYTKILPATICQFSNF